MDRLKLTEVKTAFLVLGSQRNRTIAVDSIRVGDSTILRSQTARNLGVYIDEALNFENQISEVVKICRFLLRELWQVRKYLTVDTAKTIIHATIIFRLEFCNNVYVNMLAVHIKRLQKIQTEAARLVTLTPRREHITPILQSLHWLPAQRRIEYKVLTIVFKTQHNTGPEYVRELLVSYDPGRCLRLHDRHLLFEPRYRLASAGLRSFGVAALRLWNSLPKNMRSITSLEVFEKKLKTHLSKIAFE